MRIVGTLQISKNELGDLGKRLMFLRGDTGKVPDLSIAIPVNAKGDLQNVLNIAGDLAAYQGSRQLEMLLVVNNYEPGSPPVEIQAFEAMGFRVLSLPSVRRSGEPPGFTARIVALNAVASHHVLLFDADCRIPNATELIDWYGDRLAEGVKVAYTHVGFYDYLDTPSVRVRIFAHHASRWVKRNILRIPTTRGGNYAVHRQTVLDLYAKGMLADEMNVGPAVKATGGRVAYSGARNLVVYTSGRMFVGGWHQLLRTLRYRLRYNLRVLPISTNAAQRTGRVNDPVRRYVDNRPVRNESEERDRKN